MPFCINIFLLIASESVSRLLLNKKTGNILRRFLLSSNPCSPENLFKNSLL